MRWYHSLRLCALILLLAGCATSPTGRSQLLLLSNDQLDQMGQQAFRQYQSDLPMAGAPEQAYVRCIADRIIETLPAEQQAIDWQIRAFRSEQPNAFALPGGYMGINTGMLDIADDPHQLASVIGHEIGHVLASHANERASTKTATQLGLDVLSSVSGLQTPEGKQLMSVLGMGAEYGIILPFSRRHESEADLIGIELMAQAGFDPRGSVRLWQNMARASGGGPPAWLSTHPSGDQRIETLENQMTPAMATYQAAREQGRRPNCSRP